MAVGFAYWPKSAAAKRLAAIAKRLGGTPGEPKDFFGIVVGDKRVLYRHAQFVTIYTRGRPYDRLDWTLPFGTDAQRRGVDFVLLHASEPEERFFLIPAGRAPALAAAYPKHLNVSAEPVRKNVGNDKLEPYATSLPELRRALG